MKPSTLILYRDRKGRYRWHLKSANGNKIAREAHGPGYARASGRNEGVKTVIFTFGTRLFSTEEFPPPGITLYFGELIVRNDDDK